MLVAAPASVPCRKYVVKVLAQQLRPQLEATVTHNTDPSDQKYSPDAKSAARRALKNKALAYLAASGDAAITEQVLSRYRAASNMTDKISALAALTDSEGKAGMPCLCHALTAGKAQVNAFKTAGRVMQCVPTPVLTSKIRCACGYSCHDMQSMQTCSCYS